MKKINSDCIVIGSGFGGSVTALRLVEKNYKVILIEKGKRFNNSDFPKTNWHVWKYLWFPKLFMYGIQCVTLFKNIPVVKYSIKYAAPWLGDHLTRQRPWVFDAQSLSFSVASWFQLHCSKTRLPGPSTYPCVDGNRALAKPNMIEESLKKSSANRQKKTFPLALWLRCLNKSVSPTRQYLFKLRFALDLNAAKANT